MQIRSRFCLLAVTLLLAGCHKKAPKTVSLGDVLPNFPLPPQGQALAREGGPDAMQFIFVSPVPPDSIVAYYTTVLSTGAFHLINEQKSGKATALYAEQDGPSIWVTVAPNGSDGSQITIAGATDAASKAAMKARQPTPADSGAALPLPSGKP
jgi:hypothetical protein